MSGLFGWPSIRVAVNITKDVVVQQSLSAIRDLNSSLGFSIIKKILLLFIGHKATVFQNKLVNS